MLLDLIFTLNLETVKYSLQTTATALTTLLTSEQVLYTIP